MPASLANPTFDQFTEGPSVRRSLPSMPPEIADPTSSGNVWGHVLPAVLLCLEMLSGGLQEASLRYSDPVNLRKTLGIAFPNQEVAVIATTGLGDVGGMTMLLQIIGHKGSLKFKVNPSALRASREPTEISDWCKTHPPQETCELIIG